MQPQKLCLKWNNHTSNLISVLGSFQQKETLVDVTISCEGQNIKAHRIVLSACSPYFQNMFLDNPCTHPIVIMNGMKYEDLNAILNFMYKGEVNVSHDGLSSFLQAAELLKVKGLAEVCGEKKNSTNSINQEVQQSEQNRPQRTDTPPRKRHRNRKRSLSDSNRSDDEGTSRKQHREPCSPEVHELSGDESFTGDNNSNGPPFNSVPRVPQNVYSRSHQSSSNVGAEEDEEYEVEPSKLLEQTLTTESVSLNNSNSDNNLRIERIMGNATDIESSSLQEPESPPDIKPIIDYGESSAGPSEGTMMLYNEQSQPGPSNMQDGSLLHDNSHAQGFQKEGVMNLLRCIMKEQKDIRALVDKSMTALPDYTRTITEDCPQFPVKSSEGLHLLNTYLDKKDNFNKICHFFKQVGGSDATHTVRRILQSIMTNKLSTKYNWKGTRGEKEPFTQYQNIILMVIASVRKHPHCEKTTDHEIESCIKRWLMHAKDRDGGRSMRKKKDSTHSRFSENKVCHQPGDILLIKQE